MMGFAMPAVLVAVGVGLALFAYSLLRKEIVSYREQAFSAQSLYADGEAAARERKAERYPRIAAALHRAGIEASPLAWLTSVAALAIVMTALAIVLTGNPIAALFLGGAVVVGALMRVELLRRRRRSLFELQFARVLPQLAASVRSALTLERAVRVAAAHVEDPLREELALVLADAAYGVALAEAFENMATRTGNSDAEALAAAVRIQQRFGGAIAPVIDMVADHANARLRAARELRTELAGTQLAKWFVAASMPAIFLIMFVTNADFALFYRQEPLGWAVMIVAVAFEAFGLAACNRITSLREGVRS